MRALEHAAHVVDVEGLGACDVLREDHAAEDGTARAGEVALAALVVLAKGQVVAHVHRGVVLGRGLGRLERARAGRSAAKGE